MPAHIFPDEGCVTGPRPTREKHSAPAAAEAGAAPWLAACPSWVMAKVTRYITILVSGTRLNPAGF